MSPVLQASASFSTLQSPQVSFVTNLGTVVFELDAAHAPITVANMLGYVTSGFYDGTLFHRVIPGFVVQGGGFTSGLAYKTPTYDPILLESDNGLSNLRGTVAMARTSVANSATSQFYVNLIDNTGLDYKSTASPGYAVFGEVVSGMSVIDAIAGQVTTTVGANANVPQTEIVITSATETQVGKSISRTGVISIGQIETKAKWEYSIDGGTNWKKGKGSSISLAEGSYAEFSLQVRQTDAAGNVSTVGKSVGTLVVDKTAPKIVAFSPANLAKGVGVADNIVLSFSEEVMFGTGTITLKTVAGTVVETYSITPGTTLADSLSIDPTSDLAYSTGYKLEITAGTLTDLAGNNLAALKSFKFSTTDTVSTSAATYTLGTEANKLSYVGTESFSGKGNDAANTMTGGSGNDSLWGKGGKDSLSGGAGNDIVYGEDGSDTLTGGEGADYFVLSYATHAGVDLFADFTSGEDKIGFIRDNFPGLPATLADTDLLVGAGKTKSENGAHLIYDTKTGALYYDADGNPASSPVKLAIIGKTTHPTLILTDFLIG